MSAVFEGLPVKSVSIDNMLGQRQGVLERVRAALDMLTEANHMAGAAGLGFPRLKIDEHRYSVYDMLSTRSRPEVEVNIARAIDSFGWQHLMNESGMRSLMDAKARKEWDESIEAGKFPAFTRENIVATFQGLHDSRNDIFERGVLAVFKSLSWCYKTNRPFAFGKRIVVTYLRGAVKGGSGASLGYVNHSSTDSLDDLARCFCILDGKPEADHRHAMYGAISSVRSLADGDADTEYMSVKSYRNGNGHVLFKRPDLVAKMNKILAKHFPGALAHDRSAA